MAESRFLLIDYATAAAEAKYSRQQLDQIAHLSWYFAHASVGENMMEGIADLHRLDPGSYPIQHLAANDAPPAGTQAGVIYDHNRGNPGWKAKFNHFANCVSNGWHSPAVSVVLNKLCYIDQGASANYYINSMTNLESAYPGTAFVYLTMPLTTAVDSDNYLRNLFNTRVRQWCQANRRVLFDLADIEAHDPKGAPCEFQFQGRTCQRLCDAYTTDGGHLNPEGRRLAARGLYALGAALAVRKDEAAAK